MGPPGEFIATYRATNALSTKSGCGDALNVFCYPKLGDAGRTQILKSSTAGQVGYPLNRQKLLSGFFPLRGGGYPPYSTKEKIR